MESDQLTAVSHLIGVHADPLKGGFSWSLDHVLPFPPSSQGRRWKR